MKKGLRSLVMLRALSLSWLSIRSGINCGGLVQTGEYFICYYIRVLLFFFLFLLTKIPPLSL